VLPLLRFENHPYLHVGRRGRGLPEVEEDEGSEEDYPGETQYDL
jgi:hypothetical protein